jgi:DNA mismatch repair protein MutH
VRVMPRGFYLRRVFTAALVQRSSEHAQLLL